MGRVGGVKNGHVTSLVDNLGVEMGMHPIQHGQPVVEEASQQYFEMDPGAKKLSLLQAVAAGADHETVAQVVGLKVVPLQMTQEMVKGGRKLKAGKGDTFH